MYTNKYFASLFLLLILSAVLLMEEPKYPEPFDFNQGIDINILNSTLFNKTSDIIQEYEIEEIKQKAKDYIGIPASQKDIITFETSMGIFRAKFYFDQAPKHCNNFKKLANSGFYDGTLFHRVIPGFMIQGGDILTRDGDRSNDGTGGPGWTIDAEFNDIPHKRGILSMARSSDPNSAGSQFFICVADAPHLDGQYTVFGEVIDKVHIVDHIVKTPTEYDQAKRMSEEKIPEGADPDNWITLRDPKTKKKLYSKIPKYKKKSDYEYEMRKKISSDKPALPLTIQEIRVVHKDEQENEKTE